MGSGGHIELHDESTFREGECLRLPDGTWAAIHTVDAQRVYGVHQLRSGLELKFWATQMCWLFLRRGIIPCEGNLSEKPPRQSISAPVGVEARNES
jgi:hypothetical protein